MNWNWFLVEILLWLLLDWKENISKVKNQHNGDSSIYAVKCWRIPLCVKKYVGKFLYSCWKVLETSTVDIGMCWKLPLWILDCVGNVHCPCRFTHVGKFRQPCCLVLRHPLYMLEFSISPCNSVCYTSF